MSEIKNLALLNAVRALPEVYQPIYGHDEWNNNSSRPCVDRLSKIIELYNIIGKTLNRPLRILDLGCAQGFFSLNLARTGGGGDRC